MRRVSWIVAVSAALLVSGAALAAMASTARQPRLDPALIEALNQPGHEQVDVIVYLRDRADLRVNAGWSRAERQRRIILALQAAADRSQFALRDFFHRRRTAGAVSVYTPLWIINAIAATADRAVITDLMQRTDVSYIALDMAFAPPALPQPVAPLTGTPQSNLSVINAPALWALGYAGQGVVVGLMDTGADVTHPDLSAQYRGGGNSWYDPYASTTTPYDVSGHGTQVLGVMVGRDHSGSSIGVAPGAQWIAAKIYDDFGNAQESKVHQAFQWMLDPDGNPNTADAPHVVNNSWSWNTGGCDTRFQADVQALTAAGIVQVFAAGNFAPINPSPANYPESFSVGATTNADQIYPPSSRGPTSCGGANRVFPDVVAPGVSITTTDLYEGGLFSGYTNQSGTSLAAPHASGAMALLLSAFPTLTVDAQRQALQFTAIDLGAPGADNTFGAGRIDVLAAYIAIRDGALPTPTPTPTSTHTPTPTPTATPTPGATPTPRSVFVPLIKR